VGVGAWLRVCGCGWVQALGGWVDVGVAVCCSVLQYVAVCCSVLQCAAVCCSVLQCVAGVGLVWVRE